MKKKPNNYGIISLVLGIVSISFILIRSIASFFVLFYGLIADLIGFGLGIAGIIFYAKQRKISSNGIATAGLVTSIIGASLMAIMLLLFLGRFMLALYFRFL